MRPQRRLRNRRTDPGIAGISELTNRNQHRHPNRRLRKPQQNQRPDLRPQQSHRHRKPANNVPQHLAHRLCAALRIANRTGRLRQRNVHLIRKPLTRLSHLHTSIHSQPSSSISHNSPFSGRITPLTSPISNPILPVSGEILPLTATSESQFLQSVEESGLPNTPVLPKTFQRVEESSRWEAEKRPECSSEWKNPDASGHRLRSSNQMCCQAGLWA